MTDFATALRNGDLTGWQQAWSAHAEAILDADQIIFGDNHPLLRVTPNKPGFMYSLFARFARPPRSPERLQVCASKLPKSGRDSPHRQRTLAATTAN